MQKVSRVAKDHGVHKTGGRLLCREAVCLAFHCIEPMHLETGGDALRDKGAVTAVSSCLKFRFILSVGGYCCGNHV